MKTKIVLIVCLLFVFTACENSYFKLNDESADNKNRTSEKEQLMNSNGVDFYLIKDFDLQSNFDFDSITLEAEPFISYANIIAYDSTAHVFQLNMDAASFFLGENNLDMEGFVMMVDRDTLFHGVLWSPIHSQVYSDVVLTLYIDNEVHANLIELAAAYPSGQFASAQVNLNDERLINKLAADNKLKSLVGGVDPNVDADPFPYPSSVDTMYYEQEIFDDAYMAIYGKWKLESISGGITGGGHDLDFEYLMICKYGIYLFINGETLLEAGKILVEEQNRRELKISLQPDASSSTFFYDSEKYIELLNDNQLNLNSPCCDRYNYHFKRTE